MKPETRNLSLVDRVGIEPTFRGLQPRANPSQLSVQNGATDPNRTDVIFLTEEALSLSATAANLERVTRIELVNSCLEGRLSAIREAPALEPPAGLEPALINVRSVAPFHLGYRGKLERQAGFEPTISTMARLCDTGLRYCRMAQGAGIEPAMFCLTGRRQQPTLVP